MSEYKEEIEKIRREFDAKLRQLETVSTKRENMDSLKENLIKNVSSAIERTFEISFQEKPAKKKVTPKKWIAHEVPRIKLSGIQERTRNTLSDAIDRLAGKKSFFSFQDVFREAGKTPCGGLYKYIESIARMKGFEIKKYPGAKGWFIDTGPIKTKRKLPKRSEVMRDNINRIIDKFSATRSQFGVKEILNKIGKSYPGAYYYNLVIDLAKKKGFKVYKKHGKTGPWVISREKAYHPKSWEFDKVTYRKGLEVIRRFPKTAKISSQQLFITVMGHAYDPKNWKDQRRMQAISAAIQREIKSGNIMRWAKREGGRDYAVYKKETEPFDHKGEITGGIFEEENIPYITSRELKNIFTSMDTITPGTLRWHPKKDGSVLDMDEAAELYQWMLLNIRKLKEFSGMNLSIEDVSGTKMIKVKKPRNKYIFT